MSLTAQDFLLFLPVFAKQWMLPKPFFALMINSTYYDILTFCLIMNKLWTTTFLHCKLFVNFILFIMYKNLSTGGCILVKIYKWLVRANCISLLIQFLKPLRHKAFSDYINFAIIFYLYREDNYLTGDVLKNMKIWGQLIDYFH